MAKRCVVCGNIIRTGRKYCYRHRGWRGYRIKIDCSGAWTIAVSATFIGLIFISSKSEASKAFGYLGLMVGLPMLIGLILKSVLERKKKNKLNLSLAPPV